VYYVLLDSTANLIDSFDSRDQALARMEAIVEAEPEAATEVVMVTYDIDGMPTSDPPVTPVTRRSDQAT
jgi:hypothetical protein